MWAVASHPRTPPQPFAQSPDGLGHEPPGCCPKSSEIAVLPQTQGRHWDSCLLTARQPHSMPPHSSQRQQVKQPLLVRDPREHHRRLPGPMSTPFLPPLSTYTSPGHSHPRAFAPAIFATLRMELCPPL